MKQFFLTVLASFSLLFLKAQSPSFPTSGDIYLSLKKLNVLGSVLYIAAHPDDENTRLLTYLSKDKLYRTGYLSLTRGDGGQNLVGDEQGIELGMIRTQELLAARRIDGAEQFFTRAFDFGYSKSPQETLSKWDREKILSDVVWVIRKFQPDVIITRFPTTGEGGHGQHTASAILAVEAFTAAADAKRFPDQLKWVQPWQAARILWNTFSFGATNTTSADQFKIDAGGFNPVLGKSYGEIASDSRSQHKSQGFGVARSRGEALEYFRTLAGAPPVTDLFDNVNTDWNKVKGSDVVAQLIQNTIASFDFLQPQKSVPQLVQIYKGLKGMPQSYWRDQKMKEVKSSIEAASGLWVDAFTTEPFVAQTDSFRINFSLNNRLGSNIHLTKISVDAFDSSFNKSLERNKNVTFAKSLVVAAGKQLTQPYWLQTAMSEGYYNVADQTLIGEPDVQPSFVARFVLAIEGEEFYFEKPVRFKFTDPIRGELYQPFYVVQPLSITKEPNVSIVKKGGDKEVSFHIRAFKNISGGFVVTDADGKFQNYSGLPGRFAKGAEADLSFPLKNINTEQGGLINFEIDNNPGRRLANGFKMIRYNHIPDMLVPLKSLYLVKPVAIQTAGKKIGYIVGAGDKVPEALEAIGYEVTLLTNKELSRNNLQQFDAIISGVRAYNTAEWLNAHYDKLMHYVENGGNLIVQYNTSNGIGPVRAKMGPYPFGISRARVTDENAEVSFLKPEHPVLNFPNKITADDFQGWVQERSIYHADNWDNNYEAVLRMNDAGEAPHDGSLIIAKHGKGFFTYTGLVFFRELPAAVPGAYRLMANLIALNQLKGS